jgi:hypothetical protein
MLLTGKFEYWGKFLAQRGTEYSEARLESVIGFLSVRRGAVTASATKKRIMAIPTSPSFDLLYSRRKV